MAGNTLYDTDLYAWTRAQAELLRARRFDELDLENLAEEIESVGSSDRREMRNRLARIIQHFLKFEYQPEKRSPSWIKTIRAQRADLNGVLENNATLRLLLPETLESAYRLARLWAIADTDLDDYIFPKTCPYTLEHLMTGETPPG